MRVSALQWKVAYLALKAKWKWNEALLGTLLNMFACLFACLLACLPVCLFVGWLVCLCEICTFFPRDFTMPSASMYFGSSTILWYQQRAEKTLSLWDLCDLL